ncbi:MAG: hypothetical protein H7122_12685 [Chitinophagaceae bacterium]|nr:hypothetical protein [Chitinophagaceae bacterium]
MLKYLFLLLSAVILLCCKSKKPDLQADEVVEVEDFIAFFPELALPFKITDSGLFKKQSDSSIIGYKVFTQFVPDSILTKDFGKSENPVLYSLGRAQEKGRETYLFVKAVQSKKRVAYLVCFDKKNNYLNSFPIIKAGIGNYSSASGLLDKKFQITTYHETKKATGETWYKRNVYVYNSAANDFTLILTEPNEEMIENIINPIDTFPKKNKLSGDYIRNKENFISVRDGKNTSEISFFVHFEKDNAECVGELKGVARMVSATKAHYKENGNPCTIEFTFTGTSVVMKEIEGCGSYRNIKCFFEGRFTKKKEVKPKVPKKKSQA